MGRERRESASRHGEERMRELQAGARRETGRGGQLRGSLPELGTRRQPSGVRDPEGSDPWRSASRSG